MALVGLAPAFAIVAGKLAGAGADGIGTAMVNAWVSAVSGFWNQTYSANRRAKGKAVDEARLEQPSARTSCHPARAQPHPGTRTGATATATSAGSFKTTGMLLPGLQRLEPATRPLRGGRPLLGTNGVVHLKTHTHKSATHITCTYHMWCCYCGASTRT